MITLVGQVTLLTDKYDVIIGQCSVNSIRETFFTNFNTVI